MLTSSDPIRCDVTYVTNQQLGFDYLRDQMANLPSDLRLRQQTPFHCAIVDEADSVLIDEGRTPLVVSAQQEWAGFEMYSNNGVMIIIHINLDFIGSWKFLRIERTLYS